MVVVPLESPSWSVPFKQHTSDGLAMVGSVAPLTNSEVFSTWLVRLDAMVSLLIEVGSVDQFALINVVVGVSIQTPWYRKPYITRRSVSA